MWPLKILDLFTVTATVIVGFISSLSIINITDKPVVIVMETRMPYSNANCWRTRIYISLRPCSQAWAGKWPTHDVNVRKITEKARMTNWSHFFQVGKHVKYFCGSLYMPHLHWQTVRCPGSVDHVTILRSGLSALKRSQKWNKLPCSILWTRKLLQEQLAAEPEAEFIMSLLVPVWPAAVTPLTPGNGSHMRVGGSRGPLH